MNWPRFRLVVADINIELGGADITWRIGIATAAIALYQVVGDVFAGRAIGLRRFEVRRAEHLVEHPDIALVRQRARAGAGENAQSFGAVLVANAFDLVCDFVERLLPRDRLEQAFAALAGAVRAEATAMIDSSRRVRAPLRSLAADGVAGAANKTDSSATQARVN